MSGRTLTRPLDDHRYWRRLMATVHPDRDGGDAELFVFLTALREHVEECTHVKTVIDASRRREGSTQSATHQDQADCVPFSGNLDFDVLTATARSVADDVCEPYASCLGLLADIERASAWDTTLYRQQRRGATYKQLAAIGYAVGMTKRERVEWYRVCEAIPLSRRHAGHILSKLKGRAAA
jgi:hypothetical protein